MKVASLVASVALAWGCSSASGEARTRAVIPAQTGPQPEARAPTRSLAPLIQRVRPSVVGVTTRSSIPRGEPPAELREFWDRFFGGPPGGPSPFDPHGAPPGGPVGVGSGVIIDSRGVVLTNNHVVAGASEVRVRTADEREFVAEVAGTDPETDLAVLRLKEVDTPLVAAQLGSSDPLLVGDYVVAIGSPFGLDLTVTSGIVSAKARIIGAGPYDDFLQTDAAINPGNSGGPLFDLEGRVVGINTAIIAAGQGIGFAVPIDLVNALLPQLLEDGKVTRGFLGVAIQDVTPELAGALELATERGALVASIEEGGPASRAGLRPGDVVVELDGVQVESAAALSRLVAQLPPGKRAQLTILREGRRRQLGATLGERPGGEAPHADSSREADALGLAVQPVPPELARELGSPGGALVQQVVPGSRAARGGLLPGDVIVEIDRRPLREPSELAQAVRRAGDRAILLRIRRGEGALFVVIPPVEPAR